MFANVNHNSKSQLAKLLATENITVQHVAGQKTAWFDVKNRILSLPIWKEMSVDLYDMLVIHEVGHALDTPSDDWKNALETLAEKYGKKSQNNIKGFMNIIEDARIDRRQKERFPGSRRNYVKGYKELIEQNFFGTADKNVNDYSFIDRANIYFKGGALMGIKFSSEEKSLLKKMEQTVTFGDVVSLTDEIYAWAKAKKEEESSQDHDDVMSEEFEAEGEDFGDSDDWDSDDDYSDDDWDNDSDADGDDEGEESDTDETDGEGEEKASGDDAEEDDVDSGRKTKGHEDVDNPDEPEAVTDKAWEDRAGDLIADGDTRYVYTKLPTYNLDKVITGHKEVNSMISKYYSINHPSLYEKISNDLIKFKSDENQNISFMVKEFEMKKRADEYARTSVAKTGVIDVNKLFSYSYNDDIFRRNNVVRTGKNHGFVMFVDWSGSMYSNLEKTVKQLFSMVWFCKRAQIPFEVYSFRNPRYTEEQEGLCTSADNELIPGAKMVLRELLNSNMAISELNSAMINLLSLARHWNVNAEPMTGTPLLEAMVVAPDVIEQFQKKNRVQIVNTIFLTDGAGGSFRLPDAAIDNIEYGKKMVAILQDPKTGKSYEINRTNRKANWLPYAQLQKVLLQRIKDRTGCNLIGFYLANSSNFNRSWRETAGYAEGPKHLAAKKSWRNEKFFEVDSIGYDSFYVVNTSSMKNEADDLEVDSSMTKNKIAKNFAKFSNSKKVNRVLLRNFVEKIAA